MSKIRLDLAGISALRKELPRFTDQTLRRVAGRAPSEIISNIKKQKTGIFPAGSLPNNLASTNRRKAAQGKPLKPLIDNGVLTNARKWSISKATGGYIVVPPEGRRDIVGFLQDGEHNNGSPKYKILVIPKGFVPKWIVDFANQRFSKFIQKFS